MFSDTTAQLVGANMGEIATMKQPLVPELQPLFCTPPDQIRQTVASATYQTKAIKLMGFIL